MMAGPPASVARARLAVRAALTERLTELADHTASLELSPRVLVGFSGGADSLALLTTTVWCAQRMGIDVDAAIIDHGLQPDSARVAERAAVTAERVGAAQIIQRRVEVAGTGGVEQAARAARHAALEEIADAQQSLAILLGHTLDDQAEQVLLGLARGAGARSLAGIPRRRGRILRPFLGTGRDETTGLWRADTQDICDRLDLDVWQDPMNDDADLLRIAVRTQALPALGESLGEHVREALVRTADLLRDDAEHLDAEARHVAEAVRVDADRDGVLLALNAYQLAGQPRAIRTRVIKLASQQAARDGGRPSGKTLLRRQILQVDALLTAYHGQGPVPLPGKIEARRDEGALLFTATHPQPLRGGPDDHF